MTEPKASIFIFGPWHQKKEDGTIELAEDGKKLVEWLRDEKAPVTDEIGKLLRAELKAEKDFRELLIFEINQVRTKYLDTANAVTGELVKPYRTVVEAYNVGAKMGQHQASVDLAQALSDVMDKLHLMEIIKSA